jgi:hypothetical protein
VVVVGDFVVVVGDFVVVFVVIEDVSGVSVSVNVSVNVNVNVSEPAVNVSEPGVKVKLSVKVSDSESDSVSVVKAFVVDCDVRVVVDRVLSVLRPVVVVVRLKLEREKVVRVNVVVVFNALGG